MTSNRKIAVVVAAWFISGCPIIADACADSAVFVDDSGYGCSAWAGYDCTGWDRVIQNCPTSCGTPCPAPAGSAPSPAVAADDAAEPSEAEPSSGKSAEPPGEYKVPVEDLGQTQMSNTDANAILLLTNKMRCSVGMPAVKWNADLAAQAQSEQNNIGEFEHSDCYSLPIPAGENLATGKDTDTSNYMWFSEYTASGCGSSYAASCGHYTAMTWRGVTEMGCGIGQDYNGGWVTRCQYIGNPLPNFGGEAEYTANLLPFDPTTNAAKMQTCGFDNAELQAMLEKFRSWGFDVRRYQNFAMKQVSHNPVALSVIAVGALMAVVGVSGAYKRLARRSEARNFDVEAEPLAREDGLDSSLE